MAARFTVDPPSPEMSSRFTVEPVSRFTVEPPAQAAPSLRFAPDDSKPNAMRIYDPATKLISPSGQDLIQDVGSLKSIPARAYTGVRQGVAGLGQMAEDIAYQHYSKDPATRQAEIEKYSAFPSMGKGIEQMQEESRLVAEQIEKEDPFKTKTGQIIGGAAESIGRMAVPLAAGAATGRPSVAIGGIMALTGGETYAGQRFEGKPVEEAKVKALIDAGAEGVFEALSLGPLTKIIKPGMFAEKVFKYFAREVPGELATTTIQRASDIYFDEPDPDLRISKVGEYLTSEGYGQDLIDTLLTTIVQGGMMTAGAKGVGTTLEKLTPTAPETAPEITQPDAVPQPIEEVPQQVPQDITDVPMPEERFTVEAPDAAPGIETERALAISPEQQQAVDVAVAKPERAEGALTESSKEVLSRMADDIENRPVVRGKKGGKFSSLIEGLYQDYPFLESYKGTFKRSEIVRGIRNLVSGRKLGKNQQVLADEALTFIQEQVLANAQTFPTVADSDVQVGDSFTTVTPEGVLDDVTVIADDGVTKTLKDGVVYQVPSSGENVPVVGELKKPEPLPEQAPEVVPDAPQGAPQQPTGETRTQPPSTQGFQPVIPTLTSTTPGTTPIDVLDERPVVPSTEGIQGDQYPAPTTDQEHLDRILSETRRMPPPERRQVLRQVRQQFLAEEKLDLVAQIDERLGKAVEEREAELEDVPRTPAEIDEQIREGFESAKEIREAQDTGEKTLEEIYDNSMRKVFDQNHPMYKRANQEKRRLKRAYKQAVREEKRKPRSQRKEIDKKKFELPPELDPTYAIEEASYSVSEMKDYLTDVNETVIKPLEKTGVDTQDLGIYLLYRRVGLERTAIDNPYGLDVEKAQAGMQVLQERLSPEQFAALEQAAAEFTKIRAEIIIPKLEASGMFSPELIEKVKENDAYATFNVIEYMEKQLGMPQSALPSAQIFEQVGTKKGVADPFVSTLMKDAALIRAANRNTAVRESVNFLSSTGQATTIPVEMKYDPALGYMTADTTNPPAEGLEVITYMENGKPVSVWTEKEVAEAFESPEQLNDWFKVLQKSNVVWRYAFIELNPGFWATNATRDYFRMARNLPKADGVMYLLPDLFRNLAPYSKALFDTYMNIKKNQSNEDIRKMAKERMLISVESRRGFDNEQIETARLLKQFKVKKGEESAIVRWRENIADFGQIFEQTSKLAAYRMLRDRTYKGEKLGTREIGRLVRTQAGSPDFMRRGSQYNSWNTIFLFGNAIKEGQRADIVALKERPGEFIANVVGTTFASTMMMLGAYWGWYGDDWEEVMQGFSEHDLKTNYIIPVGLTESGKSVGFKIPKDELSKFVTSVIWETAQWLHPEHQSSVGEIAQSVTELTPGLSPTIDYVMGIATYIGGGNPEDDFRKRPAWTETAQEAGGYERNIAAAQYFWNESPFGTAYRFPYDDLDKIKDDDFWTLLTDVPFSKRFLSVTGRGHGELARRQAQPKKEYVLTNELQNNRQVDAMVNKIVDEKGIDPSTPAVVTGKLFAEDLVDKLVTDPKKLMAKVKRRLLKATDNARLNALIYERIPEVKWDMYKRMTSNMGTAKKMRFERTLIEAGILNKQFLKSGAKFDAFDRIRNNRQE